MIDKAKLKAQAQMVWHDLMREIAIEIHGEDRDFDAYPLNDGEKFTVRQRANPLFGKRLNREQRRAIGHRSNRPPDTLAPRIKSRRAA